MGVVIFFGYSIRYLDCILIVIKDKDFFSRSDTSKYKIKMSMNPNDLTYDIAYTVDHPKYLSSSPYEYFITLVKVSILSVSKNAYLASRSNLNYNYIFFS